MTSDKYLPADWDETFEFAGRHFRDLDNPNQAAFYGAPEHVVVEIKPSKTAAASSEAA